MTSMGGWYGSLTGVHDDVPFTRAGRPQRNKSKSKAQRQARKRNR